MKGYGVVLFYTTSSAFRAEKTLMRAGLAVKLIPTPRELSSDCGVALRFEGDQADRVRGLLEAARVDVTGIDSMPS